MAGRILILLIPLFFPAILFLSCASSADPDSTEDSDDESMATSQDFEFPSDSAGEADEIDGAGELELSLIDQGLQNVQETDSTIQVDLKYTTEDNFLKSDVYGTLNKCYLQPEVAEMLSRAQHHLKEKHPGYSLLIYDCVRPKTVQVQMWEIVKGTPQQGYVAAPSIGSLHNYGAAVDLTVMDDRGNALDMGTDFDYFGEEAQPRLEQQFLQQGKLTQQQIDNRLLLRQVMTKAGFQQLMSEWWHYNAVPLEVAKEKFEPVE